MRRFIIQSVTSSKNPHWSLTSWKEKIALKQPIYTDEKLYQNILQQIRSYPPLVFSGEIIKLKEQLAKAGAGERFILQGGDCVERFIDCNGQTITNKLKILLQMSVILTYATRKPVIKIGRIAGQFTKPRSEDTEKWSGLEIPTYKGDSINSFEPHPEGRQPDPARLLKSYYQAAATINYIRAMIDGGFADLHYPYTWNLYAIEKSEKWQEYKDIVEQILGAIHFMESFGGIKPETLGRIEFYTSHEGLHLGFEEALTFKDETSSSYFNMGAHMLWIGERTRQLDGAHVEYFRGIANPIGIKVGPGISQDELQALLSILNPANEPGRITLITRLGAAKVEAVLPKLIKAVQETGQQVTWSCDPMHGNTSITSDKIKTRNFNDILREITATFSIHKNLKSYLAGVHFELTGEDVTECTGGAIGLRDRDLRENYQTYCDPRLNYAQSLEMAFLIAKLLKC